MREYDPYLFLRERYSGIVSRGDSGLVYELSLYAIMPREGTVRDLFRELQQLGYEYDENGEVNLVYSNETWLVGFELKKGEETVGVLFAYSKSGALYAYTEDCEGKGIFSGLTGEINIRWGVVDEEKDEIC